LQLVNITIMVPDLEVQAIREVRSDKLGCMAIIDALHTLTVKG
jgi:hypothetical protein